jgi:hypothetical protein
VLRAVAQDERSQWRNRELATERVVEALREALKVERKRRPTRPTAAAERRRREQKRRRSENEALTPAAERRLVPVAGVLEPDGPPADCVDVPLGLGFELRLAALAAKVVGAALVDRGRLARLSIDPHPADGIRGAATQRQTEQPRGDGRER